MIYDQNTGGESKFTKPLWRLQDDEGGTSESQWRVRKSRGRDQQKPGYGVGLRKLENKMGQRPRKSTCLSLSDDSIHLLQPIMTVVVKISRGRSVRNRVFPESYDFHLAKHTLTPGEQTLSDEPETYVFVFEVL